MKRERLNLWDFDDTLANSIDPVNRLARAHPEVPYRKWWQDPHMSTAAILETKPYLGMWRLLQTIPGRHVLFSGRTPIALDAWIDLYSDHPVVGPALARMEGMIPVPHHRRAGEYVPDIKMRLIGELLAKGDYEIHLYDDNEELPYLVRIAALPHLTLHRAAHGHLLNGRGSCGCGAHGG